MQLGFVSAILPDLGLEEVVRFAANQGFSCVELMCWPPGAADRRYAGVCQIDVNRLSDPEAGRIRKLMLDNGVSVSGLGYYPNPLHPEEEHRRQVVGHLRQVISAAPKLGVKIVNTFIGRNARLSVAENWDMLRSVWPDIVRHAEKEGVTIGIENCPMLFTKDEWPGGHNLAVSPAIWKALFEDIPSPNFGLNIDPSHLIWQHIDYSRAIREFGKRIVHVHAKDTRIDSDKLYEHGILGLGWHIPKLPGLGDVNWGQFFAALYEAGYKGPVCIEVEDRAFEGSLEDRQRALRQSKRFLEQYV
jgi:sugar phosphate isomerase/epimerase